MPQTASLDCSNCDRGCLTQSLFSAFSTHYLPLEQAWIVIVTDETMLLDAIVTYRFLSTYLFTVFVLNPCFHTNIDFVLFVKGVFSLLWLSVFLCVPATDRTCDGRIWKVLLYRLIKYRYFHNIFCSLRNKSHIIQEYQTVQTNSKHWATCFRYSIRSFRYSIEGHFCFLTQVLNYYNVSKTYCDVNALTVTLTGIAATGWFIGPESTTHTFNSGTLLRRRGPEQRQLIWMTK